MKIAIKEVNPYKKWLVQNSMMEFDVVKTFKSRVVDMIEAKPMKVDYLLGWEWKLHQINEPVIRYLTSSNLYENKC